MFVSALNLFTELEMWDEVVKCYQLLDKPYRAEMVVRERLKEAGETPYMLTALGDLTRVRDIRSESPSKFRCCYPNHLLDPHILYDLLKQVESHYERAWQLSHGRYARAKRSLGHLAYEK